MNKYKVLKVELDRAEVSKQILKGDGTRSLCEKLAKDMQSRAGEGYETSTFSGRRRVNVSVGAGTKEAYQDNMNNNTLLKAMR